MLIAVDLLLGQRLGLAHQIVPPELVPPRQHTGDTFDALITLLVLVFLQGRHELLHLAQSLFVVDGEEHAGLDVHQMGGHDDKLTGHLQVQPLPLFHPLQVLVQKQGDGDVPDFDFVFTQQVENEVQRPVKVLHALLSYFYHLVQMVYRDIHTSPPSCGEIETIISNFTQKYKGTHGSNPSVPL